ncbi:MAG: lipopolysaccharide biosynthesis protein [Pseudomonadota bacterium]
MLGLGGPRVALSARATRDGDNGSAPDRAGRSLRERALKAALWSSVQHGGGHLVAFGVFLVLARMVSPTEFGLVALANVLLVLIQSVVGVGFASAVIQKNELSKEELDSAFWGSLALGVAAMVGMLVGANYVAKLLGEPGVAQLIRALSPMCVFGPMLHVPEALLKRELDFRLVAIRRLLSVTLSGVVGVTLALLGSGVWSLVAQQLVAQLTNTVFVWGVTKYRPRLAFSWSGYRGMARYGASSSGYLLVEFIYRGADELVVGYLLGPTALGYYNSAQRILRLLNLLLVDGMAQVAFPLFSRIQRERERLAKAFVESTELVVLCASAAFVLLGALAPVLVPVVLGQQWEPCGGILRILVAVGIVRAASFANYPLMAGLGKPGWRLQIHALKAVVALAGIAVFGRFGTEVVSGVLVVVAVSCFPLEVWVVRRLVEFQWWSYLKALSVPLIAGVGTIVTTALLQRVHGSADAYGLGTLVVYATAGLAAYVGLAYLLAPAAFLRILGYVRHVTVGRRPAT